MCDNYSKKQVPCISFYYSLDLSGIKLKFYVLCGNPTGSLKKTTQTVINPNYANCWGGGDYCSQTKIPNFKEFLEN